MRGISKDKLLPITVVIAACVGALLLGASAMLGATSKIVWEAEDHTKIEAPFTVASKLNGSSASKYLHLPPATSENQPPTSAKTTYKVRVPVAGKYTIWARRYWKNGCGDSVSVSVDGGAAAVLGDDSDFNHWSWSTVKGKVYNLTAGAHVITVGQNAKDWGINVDQIVLLPDPTRYVPQGVLTVTPNAIIK